MSSTKTNPTANEEKRRRGSRHGLQVVPEIDQEPSPRARWFLWAFSVTLVLVAGSAFFMKLFEFFNIATTDGSDALASFLIPVLNYLLVAAGFFCLFFWAYLSGQFRDIEAAKYRMLELHWEIEQQEEQQQNGP